MTQYALPFNIYWALIGALLGGGIGSIVTAIVLRRSRDRFTSGLKACVAVGIVAIAMAGLLLAVSQVDVITKYSTGSGDDSGLLMP